MLTRRAALLASAALPASLAFRSADAQQPSTLRIAMTLADIPVTDGAPDQGTEGIRFMGYTMYDPLVAWDLSSASEPAKLVPGLATKWYQDPADPAKWIFELRQGVKFHHGASFTADDVIFSLDRTLDELGHGDLGAEVDHPQLAVVLQPLLPREALDVEDGVNAHRVRVGADAAPDDDHPTPHRPLDRGVDLLGGQQLVVTLDHLDGRRCRVQIFGDSRGEWLKKALRH